MKESHYGGDEGASPYNRTPTDACGGGHKPVSVDGKCEHNASRPAQKPGKAGTGDRHRHGY
jgi:hypothetical protein